MSEVSAVPGRDQLGPVISILLWFLFLVVTASESSLRTIFKDRCNMQLMADVQQVFEVEYVNTPKPENNMG